MKFFYTLRHWIFFCVHWFLEQMWWDKCLFVGGIALCIWLSISKRYVLAAIIAMMFIVYFTGFFGITIDGQDLRLEWTKE